MACRMLKPLPMLFSIRPEHPSDLAAITTVTRDAFADHPKSSHTEHFIVNALRNANALTVSLVAEAAGAVIGHVAVSPVQVAGAFQAWYGLGPVSVAPPQQQQGVGSALIRAALAQLQTQGAGGCVLLGRPQYYHRFGFAPIAGLVLPGVPPDHFMGLAWRLPAPVGVVDYHDAFKATS